VIAVSDPLPPLTARLAPDADLAGSTSRAGAVIAAMLGFLSFMPYPALPIGRQSALEMGSVLALVLLVPALALSWRKRPISLYLLIVAPLVLSAVKVAVTDAGDLDLCVKSIGVWAIACLTMVVVQWCAPRYALQLLTGIAVATLVHVGVGACQLYSFSNGEFPFADLYVNQSFMSVQANADLIANYIQRPFGIFPEPSAMACSLAPWILFWIAEICGVVRLRHEPARWQRILFASAAIGGLALIILSRSGHTMITLTAAFFLGALWFRKLKATPRTFSIGLLVFGVILPLTLWATFQTMGGRVDELEVANGSWAERSESLMVGFNLFARGDFSTIFFGMGSGLAAPTLLHTSGLDAVASVLLTYIYETGLVGTIVVCWIGAVLWRAWRTSQFNAAFAAIAVVWLAGITLTTCYNQLLPIWFALGWLTVWPQISALAPEPVASAAASRIERRGFWTGPPVHAWTQGRKMSRPHPTS